MLPPYVQDLIEQAIPKMPYDPNFSYFTQHSTIAPYPTLHWAFGGCEPQVFIEPETWGEESTLLPSFLLKEL